MISAVSPDCVIARWICGAPVIALAEVPVAAIAAVLMAIAMIVLLIIVNSMSLLCLTCWTSGLWSLVRLKSGPSCDDCDLGRVQQRTAHL